VTQQHTNGDTSPLLVDLRDTFAAAALTGFIRGMPSDSIFHLGLMAKQSYEVADAMLRERLRQFDRLQPIKAAEDTHATHATPCEGSLQGEGTLPNSYRENDEKRGVSDTKRGPVACSPTLTDEEREAIIWCVELLDELESSKGDALRSLLERLK
jgi:hypothetical protein